MTTEKYLLKELAEKSGKKALFNAYQTNRAEVVRVYNCYYIADYMPISETLEKTIKTQMGIYFPELKFIR